MPSMSEVQKALERCMKAEPPKDFSLSPDSSQLATVFAEMLHGREADRPLDAFKPKQLAAFHRWAE
jgi:hypothetical protein